MHAAIRTQVSSKIIAGVVALSLGAAMLTGIGGAHADGGPTTSYCGFNDTLYIEGTQITVAGLTYNCVEGAWTLAPVRVPSDTPAYTPPTEATQSTTLKEEFQPVSRGSKFLQQSITSGTTSHFPH